MPRSKEEREWQRAYAARVGAWYGPQAAHVSVTVRRTPRGQAVSLRVTDEQGTALEPRADVPFQTLLDVLEDTLASGGPGYFTLVGRPAPVSLPPVPVPEVSNPLLPW
ncbi:hypothetical protein [Deinococcus aestuarii]|uniref:hypothetical protein n=1 Tax=Deinococcus aestuarii TaxID=2774531 RepID=UPI001C0B69C0|nr:hypothetical protein [Deinococcus aestuarii]